MPRIPQILKYLHINSLEETNSKVKNIKVINHKELVTMK